MTDQHPLTDEICDELSIKQLSQLDYDYESITLSEGVKSDMRASADWQLEQVIEWIRRHPWVGSDCPIYDFEYEEDRSLLIADLKKAMRPQENN